MPLNISTLIYYQSTHFAFANINRAKQDYTDTCRKLTAIVDELLAEAHSVRGSVGDPLRLSQLIDGTLSLKQLLGLSQSYAFRLQYRVA